jgi:hypothetical protein
METSEPLGNPGIILLRPLAVPTPDARTIIVTGPGRSGTSMVAGLFARAGILDRSSAYAVTLEDRELLHHLTAHDRPGLMEAIRRRNEAVKVWAFKIPNLHGYLAPADLGLFRNPHLIVVMRGIAAIAWRHATAERLDHAYAFFEIADTMTTLVAFLKSADYPTLVVSYEKTLLHPRTAVRAIMNFAQLLLTDDLLDELVASIHPEDRTYARNAARSFTGNIDGIFAGHLVGWCREDGESRPVSVDLLVNGFHVHTVCADLFRDDLHHAAIGDGRHGFDIDITPLNLAPGTILAVRVSGRTFQLPGSGQPMWRYAR